MGIRELFAAASIPYEDKPEGSKEEEGVGEGEASSVPTAEQISILLQHLKALSDGITAQRKVLNEQKEALLGSLAPPKAGNVAGADRAARATSTSADAGTSALGTSTPDQEAKQAGVSKAAGTSGAAAAASASSPTASTSTPAAGTSSGPPRTLPRIRIKHDVSSGSGSGSGSSSGSGSGSGSTEPKTKGSASSPNASAAPRRSSTTPDATRPPAEWDDGGAVKAPGRGSHKKAGGQQQQSHLAKRKRKDSDDEVDDTASEAASAVGGSEWVKMSAANGGGSEAGPLPKISGFKLRHSPALQRRGSDMVSANWPQRKGSLLSGPASAAATGSSPAYDSAWALPTITPDTFLPKLPVTSAPHPYPTHPEQVNEDFASQDWRERERARDAAAHGGAITNSKESSAKHKGKEAQQVPLNSFYSYADGFLKSLTEDDLAWLSSQADDLEPFQIPPLGKYHRDVWEAEDAAAAAAAAAAADGGIPYARTASGGILPPAAAAAAAANVPAPRPPIYDVRFVPANLGDRHLATEEAKSGPLTERIVASLLTTKTTNNVNGGQSDDDDADADAQVDGELDPAEEPQSLPSMQQDTLGFEDRLRAELKALDLLDDANAATQWADDEVSATLRKVQATLRRQMKVNEARKSRLFELAKNRMSYQEYLICLNHIERDVEAGWNKRQRQIKNSALRKKKGGATAAASSQAAANPASVNGSAAAGAPGEASKGDQPSNEATASKVVLSDALVSAIEKRRKMREHFWPLFERNPLTWQPPRVDSDSVYADLNLE